MRFVFTFSYCQLFSKDSSTSITADTRRCPGCCCRWGAGSRSPCRPWRPRCRRAAPPPPPPPRSAPRRQGRRCWCTGGTTGTGTAICRRGKIFDTAGKKYLVLQSPSEVRDVGGAEAGVVGGGPGLGSVGGGQHGRRGLGGASPDNDEHCRFLPEWNQAYRLQDILGSLSSCINQWQCQCTIL